MPPREEIYQSRIAPGASTALGGASAAAFGASTGEALERAGSGLAQAEGQARRLDDEAAAIEAEAAQIEDEHRLKTKFADGAVGLASLQGELQREAQALRSAPPEDGADHYETFAPVVTKRTEAFLASLDDPRVAESLKPDVKRLSESVLTGEHGFALVQRAEKSVNNHVTLRQALANSLRTDPSDENYEAATALFDKSMKGVSLPEAKKNELLLDGHRELTIGRWHGVLDKKGGAAALEIIASGSLDEVLSPQQLQQMRGEAESEVNRARVEAERAAAAAERDQKEQEDTALTAAGAGIAVDANQFEALAIAAEARGDTSKALDLRQAGASARVTNAYQDASPEQITARLAEIEGVAKWQEKPDLVFQHNALDKLRTKRRNTPAEVAPPNMTDPRDIDRYVRAVEADAAERGVPATYLSADMVRDYRDDLGKGPGGRGRVLDEIALLGGSRAMAAARQLAPNDRVFHYAASLDGHARSLALAGQEAIGANDKLAPEASARSRFREGSVALSGFGPDMERGALATARAITAEMLRQQGKTHWDPEVFDEALHVALGGGQRGQDKVGGLGRWGGAAILLPDDMSQSEFDRQLARRSGPSTAFSGSRELDWAEVRKMRPMAVGDGIYQWVDAYGRPLRFKDGSPAWWNARKRVAGATATAPPRGSAQVRSAYEALPIKSSGGMTNAYEMPR